MKTLLFFLLTLYCFNGSAQLSREDVDNKRSEKEAYMLDTANHKLSQEDIDHLGAFDYYAFDSSFQITCVFEKDKGKKFEMPTSTDRLPIYRRYGYLYFTVDSVKCRLTVYQNIDYLKSSGDKNYLFIPFKDATTRHETYGGGRFLDFSVPKEPSVILDFNLAYNPYCAYSHRYSCPIPPEENTLPIKIEAGEKTPTGH